MAITSSFTSGITVNYRLWDLDLERNPSKAGRRLSPLRLSIGSQVHTLRQACPYSNSVGDGPVNVRPQHHRRGSTCRELMGPQGMPMVNSGGAPGFSG